MKMRRSRIGHAILAWFAGVVTAALAAAGAAAAVIFVDADASNGGDGQSWATAFNDLQDALAAAIAGDEIWVAEGTYFPDDGTGNRGATFFIQAGIPVYGGFAGNENTRDERDPLAHECTLSGDIGVPGVATDNSNHVVYTSAALPDVTLLDGFTIRDGYCDLNEQNGGGLYVDSGSNDGPIVRSCRFENNWALRRGGGAYTTEVTVFEDCIFLNNMARDLEGGAVYVGAATFSDCYFEGNRSSWGGGGIYGGQVFAFDCTFYDNSLSAILYGGNLRADRCRFEENVSVGRGAAINGAGTLDLNQCEFIANASNREGGAIYLQDLNQAGLVVNCLFLGNQAAMDGGAIWYGDNAPLTIANSLFSGNDGLSGGGAYLASSTVTIVNSTFSQNTASIAGGGLLSHASSSGAQIANSILWANTVNGDQSESAQIHATNVLPSVNYSCIQGLTDLFGGTGNISADPMFLDPAGNDLIPGTLDDDLRLLAGSPCIDAADNTRVPSDAFDVDGDGDTNEPLPLDLEGDARFFDDENTSDTGNGTPPLTDMGAYEGPDSDGGNEPGRYIGPTGGSWFTAEHWQGGQIPDENMDVFIATEVQIAGNAALARTVTIESGGNLIVLVGSLEATAVSIETGGLVTLNDSQALLVTESLQCLGDGRVEWLAGTLIIEGGIWQSVEPIQFGGTGSATLIVAQGSVAAPAIAIGGAGVAHVDGSLVGDVTNGGALHVGNSIGSLEIEGDFVQESSGQLVMEIAGYPPQGTLDVLHFVGPGAAVVLDGTLSVSVENGFIPEAGQSALLIAADSTLTGEFATVDLPDLAGNFEFRYEAPDAALRSLYTDVDATTSRLYVNQAAGAGGDGQSWATAIQDLQGALSLAAYRLGEIAEIWVAHGVYFPDGHTSERTRSFHLVSGVAVYGGFAGNEQSRDERNPAANVTTLSGDLLQNDVSDQSFFHTSLFENSFHVVVASNTGPGTLLDGVTVHGGFSADWFNGGSFSGGGMIVANSSLTIAQCRIRNNHAVTTGGGILVEASQLILSDCAFEGNRARDDSGGAVQANDSTISISECIFNGNSVLDDGQGAAVCLMSASDATIDTTEFLANVAVSEGTGAGVAAFGAGTVIITNCDFLQNEAGGAAAGVRAVDSAVTIVGCLFDGNTDGFNSGDGPAVEATDAVVTIDSCDFINNLCDRNGGAIRIGSGVMTLSNCDFTNNTAGWAGGALEARGSVAITGCIFTGNQSGRNGGAIHFLNAAEGQIIGCEFASNSSQMFGGAVSLFTDNRVAIDGSTFVGNSALLGAPSIFNDRSRVAVHGEGRHLLNAASLVVGSNIDGGDIGEAHFADGYRHEQLEDQWAAAALVFLDIAGTNPGTDHDVLGASVADLVGGGMMVDFVNNYDPGVGQQFQPIVASSLNGEFDLIGVRGLGQGKFLSVEYDPGAVRLIVDQLASDVFFADPNSMQFTGDPTDASLADFDGDGDLDIAITLLNESEAGDLIVLLNAGNDANGQWLGFTDGIAQIEVGTSPVALAVADFNGDGAPDAAVADDLAGAVTILLNENQGDGSLITHATIDVGGMPTDISAAPLDANGTVDIAVTLWDLGRVATYANDGSGFFTVHSDNPSSMRPESLALADVDGDGWVDCVVAASGVEADNNPSLAVHIAFSNGGGFRPASEYELDHGPADVIVADLNNDNAPDVAAVNREAGTTSVLINANDGLATMNSAVNLPVGDQPRALVAMDGELDGDLDLFLVADVAGSAQVQLLRNDLNNGQLVFSAATGISTDGEAAAVCKGDIDGDGLEDLVAVNSPPDSLGPGGTGSVAGLLNRSIPDGQATLTDVAVTFGTLISGTLQDLLASDDARLRARSRLGFVSTRTQQIDVRVGAESSNLNGSLLDISVEGRISQPGGTGAFRLRNWSTNSFEQVHTYPIGNTEIVETIENVPAANRIRQSDGRIELVIRQQAIAVFSASFDSFTDHVVIAVE